jgi:cardiolipin synthase A/B
LYEVLSTYWPHVLAVLSVVMGGAAAINATMSKRDVRSAIGWVGVIILSPIVGAMIYAVVGINRMRRKSVWSRGVLRDGTLRNNEPRTAVSQEDYEALFGPHFGSLKRLGDQIALPLSSGNEIRMLSSGDETYDALCEAIDAAMRSIIIETYIFDRDRVGLRIADRLAAAQARGIAVRVLIDAVGARYSVPSIVPYLRGKNVHVADFNGRVIMGLRLPYANLRTHRKIVVIDGKLGFVGGMNIRAAFSGPGAARDTHFCVTGPLVADLFAVAADDWQFDTREVLDGEAWRLDIDETRLGGPVLGRIVVSGPDGNLESNHRVLMGAFSVAEKSIRIMSPYFLPDSVLLGALMTAALRGVSVEIIVPQENNLAIVARAMSAQFDGILGGGVRIFKAAGTFNHSKLMVVDDTWVFAGSSNIDSRSLRLNFEIDMEVHDRGFAREVSARFDEALQGAEELTQESLRNRAFPARLLDRIFWLASPYL